MSRKSRGQPLRALRGNLQPFTGIGENVSRPFLLITQGMVDLTYCSGPMKY